MGRGERWVVVLVGLLVTSVGPRVAGAQPATTRADDPARVSFEQGLAALQAGRPADAARAFEDSYARRPVAIVQYNLALAYRALGRNRDAVAAFDRFLQEPGSVDAAQVRAVRRERDALRDGLAQVRLAVRPAQATVTVDGRVTAPGDDGVWLDPGRHVIEVRAAGYATQRREESVAGGARLRWEVALEADVAAPTAVAVARPAAVPVARPAVAVVAARVDDGRDRQRVGMETVRPAETPRAGWVIPVVVVTSVVVAAGIGVGVWALLREPGVEAPPTTTGWTVETIRVGP